MPYNCERAGPWQGHESCGLSSKMGPHRWSNLVPPIFGSDVVHRSGDGEGNVRFGLSADISRSSADVRFTPESGHSGFGKGLAELFATAPDHAIDHLLEAA